jgi:hypothetical protein
MERPAKPVLSGDVPRFRAAVAAGNPRAVFLQGRVNRKLLWEEEAAYGFDRNLPSVVPVDEGVASPESVSPPGEPDNEPWPDQA